MNALNGELSAALNKGWERFRDDDEAWVAILTGAGDKAFSVGADLKEIAQIRTGPDKTSQAPAAPLDDRSAL